MIETELLCHEPVPLVLCPVCGARPLEPWLRGRVQKTGVRRLWALVTGGDYCALICSRCREVVGEERPPSRRPWRGVLALLVGP